MPLKSSVHSIPTPVYVGERQPVYDSLLTTLHQMMGCFEETFLVIDTPDECLERQEILADIEKLGR